MYQLTYRSISRSDLLQEELEAIFKSANIINASKNITGCLIYHNKHFVQILEGNKEDVVQLYEKILVDERHHSATVLWESNVEYRFFEEWKMAFYQPSQNNIKEYVSNLLMLTQLSEKTSASLLRFWAAVGNILRGDIIGDNLKLI